MRLYMISFLVFFSLLLPINVKADHADGCGNANFPGCFIPQIVGPVFFMNSMWVGGEILCDAVLPDGTIGPVHAGSCITHVGGIAPEPDIPPSDLPANQCGSIIQVDTLSVGESVDLIGTPYSLSYFSDRVVGRVGDYTLRIPASAALEYPDTLSVDYIFNYAGRTLTKTFTPQTITDFDFVWDGNDANGNPVLGSIEVKVDVKINYLGGRITPMVLTYQLGAWKSRLVGLGGWTISNNHFYDVIRKRIYYGYGEARFILEPIPYSLNANGSIKKITDPSESATGYLVSSPDTSEVYVFDLNGRHLETRSARTGQVLQKFNYLANGFLESILDSFNNQTRVLRPNSSTIQIVSHFGQTTTLTLNADGLATRITNPALSAYNITYYGAMGLMQSFQKPNGAISTFNYDQSGYLTRDSSTAGSSTDFFKMVLSPIQRQITSTTAEGRTTNYNITTLGADVTRLETLPGGTATNSFLYSPTQQTMTKATGSGERQGENFMADLRFGQQAQFQSNLEIISPDSSNKFLSSQTKNPVFNNDDILNLSSESSTYSIGANTWNTNYSNNTFTKISPLGRQTKTTLNSHDQVVQSQFANFLPVNFGYNSNGNLNQVLQGTRSTALEYNPSGFVSAVTNSLGQRTQFAYNALGLVSQETLPDGRTINYSYDASGNLISLTPAQKPAHNFLYNLFELAMRYVAPPLGAQVFQMSYEYNRDKQLIKISNADGSIINFNYGQASGLLDSIVTPEGSYNRTYNDARQLTNITAPNNINLTWNYFGDLPIRHSVGTTNVDYTYSKLLTTSQTVNSSNITFGYDNDRLLTNAGNLTLTRNVTTGLVSSTNLDTITENFSYDAQFGELTQYAVNQIFREVYTRDNLGRINSKAVTVNGVTTNSGYTYDSVGRLTQVAVNGTLARSYTYDSNSNRLSLQVPGVAAGGNSCEDDDDDHHHHHVKNCKHKSHHKKHKHHHDKHKKKNKKHKHKHKHHHHHHHHHHDHDDDNCTPTTPVPTSTNATYDNQDRILTYGARTFSYNAKGEVISTTLNGNTTTYLYDSLGALLRVRVQTGAITDTYDYANDGLGRRVEVRKNSVLVKRYVYDMNSQLVAELNPNGTLLSHFVYATRAHSPDYLIRNGVRYKIIHDQLGSVRLVVNSVTGAIASSFEYDEFGNVLSSVTPDFQPFGFAGGVRDLGTPLVRFGARDYDPSIGRWLSKDPILFNGGDTNLYGYVMMDPVNFVDPMGLLRWPWDIYDDATRDAQNSGLPGAHNGQQDAYRHCVASCMMTQENGDFMSELLGDLNENRGDWFNNQETGEKCMDQSNNSRGRDFGREGGNCSQQCGAAASGGGLSTYIGGTSPGYWGF